MYIVKLKFNAETIILYFDSLCFETFASAPIGEENIQNEIRKICAKSAAQLINATGHYYVHRVRRHPKSPDGYILMLTTISENWSCDPHFIPQGEAHQAIQKMTIHKDILTSQYIEDCHVKLRSTPPTEEECRKFQEATYVFIKNNDKWDITYYKNGERIKNIIPENVPNLINALKQIPASCSPEEVSLVEKKPLLEAIIAYHDHQNHQNISSLPSHYWKSIADAGSIYLDSFHQQAESELPLIQGKLTTSVVPTVLELAKRNNAADEFHLNEKQIREEIREEIGKRQLALKLIRDDIDKNNALILALKKNTLAKVNTSSVKGKLEDYLNEKIESSKKLIDEAEKTIKDEENYHARLSNLTIEELVALAFEAKEKKQKMIATFKDRLAYELYEAGRIYFEKHLFTTKPILQARDEFNRQFASIDMGMANLTQLKSIDNLYALFRRSSFSKIQALIQQLLNDCNLYTVQRSAAQDLIYQALDRFSQAIQTEKSEFNLPQPLFTWTSYSKTGFTWAESTLAFENKISQECEEINEIVQGRDYEFTDLGTQQVVQFNIHGLVTRAKHQINNDEISNHKLHQAKKNLDNALAQLNALGQPTALHGTLLALQEKANAIDNQATMSHLTIKNCIERLELINSVDESLKAKFNEMRDFAKKISENTNADFASLKKHLETINKVDKLDANPLKAKEQLKQLKKTVSLIQEIESKMASAQNVVTFIENIQQTSNNTTKDFMEVKKASHGVSLDTQKDEDNRVYEVAHLVQETINNVNNAQTITKHTVSECQEPMEIAHLFDNKQVHAAKIKPVSEKRKNKHDKKIVTISEPHDIVLLLLDTSIAMDENVLKKEKEKYPNKPILIKQDDQISLYGFSNGVWRTTVLDDPHGLLNYLFPRLDIEKTESEEKSKAIIVSIENTRAYELIVSQQGHDYQAAASQAQPKTMPIVNAAKPSAEPEQPLSYSQMLSGWFGRPSDNHQPVPSSSSASQPIAATSSQSTSTSRIGSLLSSFLWSKPPAMTNAEALEPSNSHPAPTQIESAPLIDEQKPSADVVPNQTVVSISNAQNTTEMIAMHESQLAEKQIFLEKQSKTAERNAKAISVLIDTLNALRAFDEVKTNIMDFATRVGLGTLAEVDRILFTAKACLDDSEEIANSATSKALNIQTAANVAIYGEASQDSIRADDYLDECIKDANQLNNKLQCHIQLLNSYLLQLEQNSSPNKKVTSIMTSHQERLNIQTCVELAEIIQSIKNSPKGKTIPKMLQAIKNYPTYNQNSMIASILLSELKSIAQAKVEKRNKENGISKLIKSNKPVKALIDNICEVINNIQINNEGNIQDHSVLNGIRDWKRKHLDRDRVPTLKQQCMKLITHSTLFATATHANSRLSPELKEEINYAKAKPSKLF